MYDPWSTMIKDDQGEQNPRGSGWNGEEIECTHVHHVVFKKCAQGLRRRFWAEAGDKVGDVSLGDIDSQFE